MKSSLFRSPSLLITLLMSAILAVALTACGSDPATPTPVAATAASNALAAGATVTTPDVILTDSAVIATPTSAVATNTPPPTVTTMPATATSAATNTVTDAPSVTPLMLPATATPAVSNTTSAAPASTSAVPASPSATEVAGSVAVTPAPVVTRIIDHVAPGKHEVALTFDAGSGTGRVADILATLQKYNVHITFFLTGQWAEQNPDMARLITADGNEVGNHSYDHPYFTKIPDAQMVDELAHAESIIQQTTGAKAYYWRPPFGDYDKHVIDVAIAQGYQPLYWTLDSLDSVGQPKTKDFIIKRVTENNIQMDGAIILQHMAADASADALPTEIERLQAKGLKIVTLSELLK